MNQFYRNTIRVVRRPFVASILAIAFFGLDAQAQEVRPGSIYSRFAIGELESFHSSQTAAMGGGGYGLSSGRYKTFGNPASWSNQVLTGVSGGLSYRGISIDDGINPESKVGASTLNSIQFGFPLLQRKLGVGLSFAPLTRVGYDIRFQDDLTGSGAQQDSAGYTVDLLGNGGLHSFTAGLGLAGNDRLSVGVSGEFIFGLVEETRQTSFVDPTFATTNLTQSTQLSGVRATIGVLGNLTGVMRDNDRLSAGLSFTTPSKLTGRRTNVFGEAQDRDTLGTSTDASATLPLGIAGGASYAFDGRWLFLADAAYQPWTNFESDVTLPGYTPGSSDGLSDRLRISGGAEVLPAGRDGFAPYFERVAYRLGVFYDNGYIRPNGIDNVRTLGITGGMSIPLGVPGTRLDITTEVGRRGKSTNGLVRDTFFKFGLNLNIGERWFVKRKLG